MKRAPSRPRLSPVVPFLVSLALISLLLAGCGENEGPTDIQHSGPYPDVEALWINGYYFTFPAGSPSGFTRTGYVIVRENGPKGSAIPDLAVVMDGTTLSFDDVERAYVGSVPALAAGESATLTVGNGIESVTATVTIPAAPTALRIPKGYWDTSEPWTPNTLRWTNPETRGESIAVFVYADLGEVLRQIFWTETSQSEADYLTIYNQAIPYYETYDRLAALVCHVNYAYFEGNPNNASFAALAGVWGSWPAFR
jgi:hypothetical protein